MIKKIFRKIDSYFMFRSYRTPFVLGVVSDNDEDLSTTSTSSAADTMNRGFRLFYRQNPCT